MTTTAATATLDALVRAWVGGDDSAGPPLHDLLAEAGARDPAAALAAARDAAPRKMCLVTRYPGEHEPVWHGGCGPYRRIATPGPFDGSEGRTGRRGDVRTGWYEPVEWLTVEEAALALAEAAWESEVRNDDGSFQDEGVDEAAYGRDLAEQFAATPDDFPGLAEHYPWAVSAWHEVRHAAALGALRRALAG